MSGQHARVASHEEPPTDVPQLVEADGAALGSHGRSSRDASRLAWAKFWLVATGVWWGVCMQLIVYQGAGHELAMLPNLDWYLGMMLVHSGKLCASADASSRYATVKQIHVVPIAVCDYVATIGTTVGLILSGSALFGIIYSAVTVWTALFTCLLLRKRQTAIKMAGIATVVLGLALPTLDQAKDTTEGELEPITTPQRLLTNRPLQVATTSSWASCSRSWAPSFTPSSTHSASVHLRSVGANSNLRVLTPRVQHKPWLPHHSRRSVPGSTHFSK